MLICSYYLHCAGQVPAVTPGRFWRSGISFEGYERPGAPDDFSFANVQLDKTFQGGVPLQIRDRSHKPGYVEIVHAGMDRKREELRREVAFPSGSTNPNPVMMQATPQAEVGSCSTEIDRSAKSPPQVCISLHSQSMQTSGNRAYLLATARAASAPRRDHGLVPPALNFI